MEDKTPIYLMIIVGIVAIVGIVVMITASSRTADFQGPDIQEDEAMLQDDAITGYVAYSNSMVSLNAFGKIFFVLFLAGIAAYMYFRHE